MSKVKLNRVYKKLCNRFGRQGWWSAKTRIEVIIGAMLTQNTAWSNVEKAMDNLRKKRLLSFQKLSKIRVKELAGLIRPAGYFNLKARRLKNLLDFIQYNYQGNLNSMRRQQSEKLREQLLSVNGIGPETADSILLYAFNKPIFVVDAYTKRIFSRLKVCLPDSSYVQLQELFMNNLTLDIRLFNEYHALIVKLGKDYCRKNKPRCYECPIKDEHNDRRHLSIRYN